MNFIKITYLLVLLTLCLSSCKKEGPIEKAGSRVDEVVDNVKEGDPALKKKGTLEKAGEAVDEVVSN